MTIRLQKNPLKAFQPDPVLREYAVLKARVREVLILGRSRIEREFMVMRYHTGLLINEHIRLNGDRAAYGARAALRLEKDLNIDHTELNRYVQFAKAYPIDGGRRQLELNLPWTHYRKLMIIPNGELRYELTAQAEKNQWPFGQIESRVRYAVGRDDDKKQTPRLPFVCLGSFFTYKIIRSEGIPSPSKELLLDLGFKHRLEMSLFQSARGAKSLGTRFREGMIVTAAEGAFSLAKAEGADEDSLYTYKARVEKVLDGDSVPRRTAQEMRVGPSEPTCGSGFQSALSGVG